MKFSGLTIVARASGVDAERKLTLAGADRVVLPYTTAGQVMANLVLKPQVTAFLDVVTTAFVVVITVAVILRHVALIGMWREAAEGAPSL